jgi:divalent metal cation (Fe/Co/Zn/Cd) transporter
LFKEKTSVALLSICSNTLLVILKVIVGIFTNSVSVLAEALHSGFDLMAAVTAYFCVRVAGPIASKRHKMHNNPLS